MCWAKFFKSVFLVLSLGSAYISCNSTGFENVNVEGLEEFLDLILVKGRLIRLLDSVDKLELKKLSKKKYVKNFIKRRTKAVILRKNGKIFLGQFNEDRSAVVPFTDFYKLFYIIHNMSIYVVYFAEGREKIRLRFGRKHFDSEEHAKKFAKSIEKMGIKPVNIASVYLQNQKRFMFQILDDAELNEDKCNNDLACRLVFSTKHTIGYIFKYDNKTFLVKRDPKSKKFSSFDSFGQNCRLNLGTAQVDIKFEKPYAKNSPWKDYIFIIPLPTKTNLDLLGLLLEKANCKVTNFEGLDKLKDLNLLKNYYGEAKGLIAISLEPAPEGPNVDSKYLKGLIFWDKDQIYLANIDPKTAGFVPFKSFGDKLYLLNEATVREVEFNMKDGKIIMEIKGAN